MYKLIIRASAEYIMKIRVSLSIFLAACFLLGCAAVPESVPISLESQSIEHNFLIKSDDPEVRNGVDPTYVLIERQAGGAWYIAAVSKEVIKRNRSNQELLFVTRNYTNIVPYWTSRMYYRINKETDVRSNYVFQEGGGQYDAGSSSFTRVLPRESSDYRQLFGRGVALIKHYALDVKKLRLAIDQANVIEGAKIFNKGLGRFAAVAPVVPKLSMDNQVWMLQSKDGGDKGWTYFVPRTAFNVAGDYMDENSYLFIATQFESGKFAKLTDLRSVRFTSRKSRDKDGISCATSISLSVNQATKRTLICAYSGSFIIGHSPSVGRGRINEIEGVSYTLQGRVISSGPHRISLESLDEVKFFYDIEAADLLSKFQRMRN